MDPRSKDLALARNCLEQQEAAWEELSNLYRAPLASLLLGRGASSGEAEDLIAELWLDLGGFGRSREPLLARFSGTGSLKSWLSTVAIQRFCSLRRKKRLVVDLGREESFRQLLERTAAAPEGGQEEEMAERMRTSLAAAWKKCPATPRVMLQLLHIESVTQREIARLWRWHESKVSRSLDAAARQIQKDTLREIAALDPDAILCWNDFVELGTHYDSLFSAPTNDAGGVRCSPCAADG